MIPFRTDTLSNWLSAQAQTPAKGKLPKGVIGLALVETNGQITEVIARIGPSDTPTPWSQCPVVFTSPLTATGPNFKTPVVDVTAKTNSLITLSGGQFVAVDDDPGEYATVIDEGGGERPIETAPAITSVSLVRGSPEVAVASEGTISLSHDGTISDMVLRVVVSGAPEPNVTAQIESQTTITPLTGTKSSGTWSFPITISSTATGLHVITITASSTTKPDSVQTRQFTIARAAAPAPVSIAITSLSIKNDATGAVVTSLGNGSGVTLRADATTTTTATATAYQWRRGQSNISGATSQTYALQTADDDANVSCAVTVTRTVDGQTATATATAGISVGSADIGWTPLGPASDSRLIYVATNGNDSQAAAAKGRGYYLPGDPEIGPDPTNPVGPIAAYASVEEAAKRFRGKNWNGTDSAGGIANYGAETGILTGFPDWLLFRRGQTFTMPTVQTAWGPQVRPPAELIGWWTQWQGQFSYHGGGAAGRSDTEPGVITAWGPLGDARPIVDVLGVDGDSRNMAIISIETPNNLKWKPSDTGRTCDNLLLEDVKARSFGAANVVKTQNARFRRCVISNGFNGGGHNQGLFISGTNTFVLEECIFDRNGYKEDPLDATKWTGGVVSSGSAGAMPMGTGVQPTRTYYDRNLYLSSYSDIKLRGCIISRGGGGSSVQMRQGGVCERNLFIWNEQALGGVHPQSYAPGVMSMLVRQNCVLHDDHLLPPGGFGIGFGIGGLEDDLAVADDNVLAHFHRGNNGGATIQASGKPFYDASSPAGRLGRVVVKDNAILREFGGIGIEVPPTTHTWGVLEADVTGNSVSLDGLASLNGNATRPSNSTYSGNKYHVTGPSNKHFQWSYQSNGDKDWRFTPYVQGDLAGWKSAGFDSDVTAVQTDFAAFKAAAGWSAPERDIVSYMQSVDPTYVADEEVFVDEDATVKQATRQKVWQVLSNATLAGSRVLTEARAKQVARRYHAFVTFIQRAKANRKGAWDPRYTAEAVNNYIREGFGKTKVSGPYLATMQTLESYS